MGLDPEIVGHTIFINGHPVTILGIAPKAFLGIQPESAPDLFVPNVLLVASDGLLTRVGSITSGPSRFMPWRPAEGGEPTLEALIRGLFEPAFLLDYIHRATEGRSLDVNVAVYDNNVAVAGAIARALSGDG